MKSKSTTGTPLLFDEALFLTFPQGKNVRYYHLKKHISWRYQWVKRLLGRKSLPTKVTGDMIKQVFIDHGIDWKGNNKGPTQHSGWFRSLVREFGSRGGVKSAKMRKELGLWGKDSHRTFPFMTGIGKKKVAKTPENTVPPATP